MYECIAKQKIHVPRKVKHSKNDRNLRESPILQIAIDLMEYNRIIQLYGTAEPSESARESYLFSIFSSRKIPPSSANADEKCIAFASF